MTNSIAFRFSDSYLLSQSMTAGTDTNTKLPQFSFLCEMGVSSERRSPIVTSAVQHDKPSKSVRGTDHGQLSHLIDRPRESNHLASNRNGKRYL